jgi:hypothetical protein
MENIYSSVEYSLIKLFYSDKKAKRSGIPYINHINEGLELLRRTDIAAQKAFCLHPIIQSDADFQQNHGILYKVPNISREAIVYAMEYRHVANSFLPRDTYTKMPVKASLLLVNEMLRADKIQNYSDFKKNREKYINEVQLEVYFKEWFTVLGVKV